MRGSAPPVISEPRKPRVYSGSMQTIACSFTKLTNAQLVDEVMALASREREATAQLIASLAELEERGLHHAEGYSSLFTYCMTRLHMSEDAAYNRFKAASAARRFPVIIERLASGALSLTAVRLLAPHLTPENHRAVLDAAAYKSKREVEQQVVAMAPQPALPSSLRRLPSPAGHGNRSQVAPSLTLHRPDMSAEVPTTAVSSEGAAPQAPVATRRPAVVAPCAPERYRLQVTISREAHETLRRVQDLLRHAIPSGDPAAIVERALVVLLGELERKKSAKTDHPRVAGALTPGSRHVAAAVKRAVWARDDGRCAFVGSGGRCDERGFLEYHHVTPFAEGGETTVENLELRCRAHNAYEAAEHFGLFTREAAGADDAVPERTTRCYSST